MTENYEEENEFIDCARYGEFEEVQKMIKANINVNFQQPESGNTALHCAAANGHVNIVKLLIKADADIDIQNNMGSTALAWAAYLGELAVVKTLAKSGAKLNVCNKQGQTALDLSFQTQQEVYELLLKLEAKPGEAIRQQQQQQQQQQNDVVNDDNVENDNEALDCGIAVTEEEIDDESPIDDETKR